ncbi:helix-turn-helix transcriptional regulator [Bacillus sp. AG4(2022)]|uniref:helix-turn-helix transcriptional regulator n=1 Tax=Bacillus sp. AG4(2022) TaxID=2962594 RepID=UPI0028810F8B|nr:helix-turn-helix transcriptional regulator [Bacillus sp. AG4(2022)]MDT0163814.1 helix-turn-helix transcriptional regulator [Bacillus sp. AG4(2022)]
MKLKCKIGELVDQSPYKREYIRQQFNKSRNTISNWCTGKAYPSAVELFKLAKLLGVKVDDLYEEDKDSYE